MKATQLLFQSSLMLTLAVGVTITPTPAQAQQGPVLDLAYGGAAHCRFQTDNGVNINGDDAGEITASGNFISGCPTGGSTPPASATVTTSPATVASGESAHISWQGVGDICRYDTGSSLPVPVPGWPIGGLACIGAEQCAAGNTFDHVFSSGGTYAFKLSCTTGAHGQQQEDTKFDSASVVVTGTPPVGNCPQTSGFSRQTIGTVAAHANTYPHSGARLEYWSDLIGWNFSGNELHYGWPGMTSNGPKVYIHSGQYLALQFTVPANYPYYAGGAGPSGLLTTTDSHATDIGWAVSISSECGDFAQPALPNPDHYCYAAYTVTSGGLGWAVSGPAAAPLFTCDLERGQTYWLNIAPLDLNTTSTNCPVGSTCNFNLYNGGSHTQGTYGQVPYP